MPFAPGTRLGPYEIVAPLGAGGMGEVFRSRDTVLRRDVAIKFLAGNFSAEPERLRRFLLEAQSAAALSHPNILAIYQVGDHEGSPYIVSELLEGQTLRRLLQDGALPLRRALDFACQIARGLAAAHAKGIVHRDLKPENVFISRDNHAKILDFGLAKLLDHPATDLANSPTLTAATSPGTVLGTAAYMSPEQIRGEVVDTRTDIFSLGVMLREMVTGRHPFLRQTTPETLVAILKEDPAAIPVSLELPPAVGRLMEHCLEKSADLRFQSAQDLAYDIESMSTISASQKLDSLQKTRGIHWGRILAWAGATAGIVVIAILLALQLRRPADLGWSKVTFDRGMISAARFASDSQSIVYSASWRGRPFDIFTTHLGSPESRALHYVPARLLAVSRTNELAISLRSVSGGPDVANGTLARAALEGGTPRELLDGVDGADWSPDGNSLALIRTTPGVSSLEYPAGKEIYKSSDILVSPRVSRTGMIALVEFANPNYIDASVLTISQSGERKVISSHWTDITGLAWSPNGERIWLTGRRSERSVALFELDLNGRERLLAKVPQDLQLMDVSSDGRALIATLDWHAEIYAVLPGETEQRDFSYMDFPLPYDFSSEHGMVLFQDLGESSSSGGGTSYLATADGSAPIKLGSNSCGGISPNGLSIACITNDTPSQVAIYSVKAGTPRLLPPDPLNKYYVRWFPNGRDLLLVASAADHGVRLYIQPVDGSPAEPISPEGSFSYLPAISPDGTKVATLADASTIYIYDLTTKKVRELPNNSPGNVVAGWTADSHSIYVVNLGHVPATVYVVDIATGQRKIWKTLSPPDPTGVDFIYPVMIAPNGQSYAYGLSRRMGDLYVVTGLK